MFPNGVPYYFSGTNCRIFADAVVTGAPTQGFTNVTVYIDNEVVAEFQTDLGVVAMQHASTAAMFDSTHFTPGSTVNVWATATDEDNAVWTSQTYQIPVKNKFCLYGRYDLEVAPLTFSWYEGFGLDPAGYYSTPQVSPNPWAGATGAYEVYSSSGQSQYNFFGPVTNFLWTMEDYLYVGMYSSANVYYVSSHGGAQFGNRLFESDRGDWHFFYPNQNPVGWDSSHQEVYGTLEFTPTQQFGELKPRRVASNGVGLPPFNTGDPPINLAVVWACHSGEVEQTFSDAYLFPYGNVYAGQSEFPENQAFVGWYGGVPLDVYRSSSKLLFELLREGHTVNEARKAVNYATEMPAVLLVYGDWDTRISGVYDPGGPNPSLAWKRGL